MTAPRAVHSLVAPVLSTSSARSDGTPRKKKERQRVLLPIRHFVQRAQETHSDRPRRKHALKVLHSPPKPLDATPRLSKEGRPPKRPPNRPPNCACANEAASPRRRRRGSQPARISPPVSVVGKEAGPQKWRRTTELPLHYNNNYRLDLRTRSAVGGNSDHWSDRPRAFIGIEWMDGAVLSTVRSYITRVCGPRWQPGARPLVDNGHYGQSGVG